MEYIYTRVSTDKQETANQVAALRASHPEAKVVEEVISGAKAKPELEKLLASLMEGDTLIVYALDRLGRHARKALELMEELQRRGVTLVSKREGIDMSTTTGKFIAHVMLGFAEMERSIISERTRTALVARKQRALALGIPWGIGAPPKLTQEAWQRIAALRASGLTVREIAAQVGISIGTVSNILNGRIKRNREQWYAAHALRAKRKLEEAAKESKLA